jgi:hypothetical protein
LRQQAGFKKKAGSAGMSYLWQRTRFSADMIYASGSHPRVAGTRESRRLFLIVAVNHTPAKMAFNDL